MAQKHSTRAQSVICVMERGNDPSVTPPTTIKTSRASLLSQQKQLCNTKRSWTAGEEHKTPTYISKTPINSGFF